MRRDRRPLLLLTVVLVLGLTLGAAGTATAGGLSVHAVKKIAAKVLRKKAKKLSVAHAATATDATTLGGQPPSAYRATAFTVTLSASTGVVSFNKTLPTTIPSGTYQVSLYVTASETVSAGTAFFCELNAANGSAKLVDAYGQLYQNFAILSATRVVTVTGPMNLYCKTLSGSFSTPIPGGVYAPPQLFFLRLDSTTALGDATPAH